MNSVQLDPQYLIWHNQITFMMHMEMMKMRQWQAEMRQWQAEIRTLQMFCGYHPLPEDPKEAKLYPIHPPPENSPPEKSRRRRGKRGGRKIQERRAYLRGSRIVPIPLPQPVITIDDILLYNEQPPPLIEDGEL